MDKQRDFLSVLSANKKNLCLRHINNGIIFSYDLLTEGMCIPDPHRNIRSLRAETSCLFVH